MKGDVLIVDDAPSNVLLLEKILKREGYSVRSAINGTFALTNAKYRQPDLVLMDVNMPDMDGYQVCRFFQSDPVLQGIPVIFISDLSQTQDKVKAFKSGGVDYIPKPFQVDEVLARIEYQMTIRRQQQHIENQNRLLEQSNQRLEEFAFLVAHDLKHPLQNLMHSTDRLKQDNDLGQAQCQQELEHVNKLSHSMHRLVDGLLNYSRVGAGSEAFERVDCQTVVDLALSDLQKSIHHCQARISAKSLPVVVANSSLLLQLFQNLVQNSLKFQPLEGKPQIQISAKKVQKMAVAGSTAPENMPPNSSNLTPLDYAKALIAKNSPSEEWLFEVRDNGIGMAAEKCRRIFEMFHRCHDQNKYPGHGIGLSICQKIIEHHGGRIWARSTPGLGTSIYFTLPMA